MKAGTPALLLPQSSEAAPLFGRLRKGAEEHFILPESACMSLQRSNTQFSPAQLLPSLCVQSLSLLSRDNPVIEEWEGWSRKTDLSHSCWRQPMSCKKILLCNLEATRFRDSRNQEIAMGDATSGRTVLYSFYLKPEALLAESIVRSLQQSWTTCWVLWTRTERARGCSKESRWIQKPQLSELNFNPKWRSCLYSSSLNLPY